MKSKIFNPETVAVIGATDRADSVGRGLIENLKKGDRKIFLVNPKRREIFGEKSYSKITDIEEEIDLAVIAIPKEIVTEAVDDCIEKRVGAIIIISAGFSESDEEGKKRQDEIAEKLKKAKIPLVGPNCLGVIRPSVNLNASFAPGNPKEGKISLISQSGALIDSIIDGAKAENYGFSLIISVGNAAVLSLTDYIKIADEDPDTHVIALYIEGVKRGKEFLKTLKSTTKPVIVLKGGKVEKAREAICSHTGSLAGEYPVFSAALKQGGAIEVGSVEELFDTAKAVAWQPNTKKGVGIVTNGGGAGVLLTDCLYPKGFIIPDLKKHTLNKISSEMHPDFSKGNPLDIVGDALPGRYELACRAILEQEDISSLVVIQTLQIMTDPMGNAKSLVKLKDEYEKPIIAVFMGAGKETREAISFLEENEIPNYTDPARAAKALKALKSQ